MIKNWNSIEIHLHFGGYQEAINTSGIQTVFLNTSLYMFIVDTEKSCLVRIKRVYIIYMM